MLLTQFKLCRFPLRCSGTLLVVGLLSSFLPIHIHATNIDAPIKKILKVGTIYSATSYVHEPVAAKNNLGFDYELSQKFANYLNATLQVIPYDNITNMLRDLRRHKIDVVAAGMTKTEDRSKGFIYSPPLYQIRQQLIYKMGSTKRPKNFKQLKGSILVTANSAHAALLEQVQQKIPRLDWQTTTRYNPEELMMQIAQGKIKYTIADSSLLAIHRRHTPELGIGFSVSKPEDVVWILAKQKSKWLVNQLLNFWSIELKQGTFAQLNEKYFGHIQRFDFVDTRAFIRAIKRTLPRYKKYFQRYAGNLDWRKLAATSYQESHWNPKATSPTGVRGMMMLTRPTAKQMRVKNRLDPIQSIRGGAQYLNSLFKRVPTGVPEHEKMWFALAAYNIGFGHMMDARKLSRRLGLNPNAWNDIKKMLPLLHQRKYYRQTRYGYARGKEAVHYVDNIRRYFDTLVWLDTHKNVHLTEDQILQEILMSSKTQAAAPPFDWIPSHIHNLWNADSK